MRILLIEDDDLQARLLQDFLKRHSADGANGSADAPPVELQRVSDGDEALSLLPAGGKGAKTPNLVILDLGLERIDGLDFLLELRSIPRYRSVPVVVLSGTAHAEDVRSAYERGANSYLKKPDDPRQLGQLVDQLLGYWGRYNLT